MFDSIDTSAVAATLAVVVSVLLLIVEYRRDYKEKRKERRDQAEHVFVMGAVAHSERRPGVRPKWGLYIVNGSDKPIYDINVKSQWANGQRQNPDLNLGALPPGRFFVGNEDNGWGNLDDYDRKPEDVELVVKGKAKEIVRCVSFVDASGKKWSIAGGTNLLDA